jgi:hypothetical protein
MNNTQKTPLQIAVRVFIIVGLIILLILLSFGIIKLVPKALDSLTNLKNSIRNTATTTDNVITGEEPSEIPPTTQPTPPPLVVIPPAPVTPPQSQPIYKPSPADLIVSITKIGVIDANTNKFRETSNIGPNDRLAVQFQVTNIGGSATGMWKFRAQLPTNNIHEQIYNSAYQSSIPAGKTSYFTIGFYNAKSGSNQISIDIDSTNQVSESNENNNRVTRTLYTNFYQNNPYPYNQ